MNPSAALARAIVGELVACGVRDVVLCPGSRNAPLSLAVHGAAMAGTLRLHVRVDERTAGFLALGLGRGSGRPATVITTSGTAVANLHPAVLEAHHGGVPMVVVSADRPPRLRGVGANQVIDQAAVFGGGVLRWWSECGAAAVSSGGGVDEAVGSLRVAVGSALGGGCGENRPGPVQVNVSLDTPLLPDDLAGYDAVPGTGAVPDAARWAASVGGDPDVSHSSDSVIPGPGPGEKCLFIVDLANTAGIDLAPIAARHPVVSEAGGLADTHVLAAGMWLLDDDEFMAAHRPDRVIVLGRVTLFRQVTGLLTGTGLTIDMVSGPAGVADVARRARLVAPVLGHTNRAGPQPWVEAWRRADEAALAAIDDRVRAPSAGPKASFDSSPSLAYALTGALPEAVTLVLGSSQSPRDVGLFAATRRDIRVIANRGVAGIDGTISTAVGVALSHPGPTVALMGDLTFVHDVTGLAIGPGEPRPDLTIVVANNDGGAIFATLEQGAPQYSGPFERVFATPLGADLGRLAGGFGAGHLMVTTAADLAAALGEAPDGIRVIEVPVHRDDLRRQFAETSAAVASAVAAAVPPALRAD